MLWEVNVKDHSGHREVCTEQGASASKVTAAEFLGYSLQTGSQRCSVTLYAGPSVRSSQTIAAQVWVRLPASGRPKQWDSIEEPVCPLDRNSCGHPLAGLFWERRSEEEILSKQNRRTCRLGMSSCPWKITTFLVRVCGQLHLSSGFLHGASLSECPRPRGGEVPRSPKTVFQESISERSQFIEAPKVSCRDSVEMVKHIPQERSSERICVNRAREPRPGLAAYAGAVYQSRCVRGA